MSSVAMRAESSQGEMSTDPIDLHIKLVIFHAKKRQCGLAL